MHYHIRVQGHLVLSGKTGLGDCALSSRRLEPHCSQGRSRTRPRRTVLTDHPSRSDAALAGE